MIEIDALLTFHKKVVVFRLMGNSLILYQSVKTDIFLLDLIPGGVKIATDFICSKELCVVHVLQITKSFKKFKTLKNPGNTTIHRRYINQHTNRKLQYMLSTDTGARLLGIGNDSVAKLMIPFEIYTQHLHLNES